ncbi:hypothetical protein GCM10010909_19440 [Acidocella aquatica]|uniref:Porin n=1 Tax=Acidocella aquatica TaxID=1922313 RepID=A0ABQ6AAK9_9PROT|nr:hypothetical protein [Acidocella aquatica]GLR67263.1 hypothetical protein GCM10010909_19440 [Acidocella aquatica]
MNIRQKILCLTVSAIAIAACAPTAKAMSGPAAIQIDGGPLGPLELSGAADGMAYFFSGTQRYADTGGIGAPATNNAGPKAVGMQFMNGEIELQKNTGVLQATIEVGSTNYIYLGLGQNPSSIQSFSTGPLYGAYVTLAPTGSPVTISVGQVTGLEGYEAGQEFNNANIFLSQIAYVESGQGRGVIANYASGPVSASVFFGDGYDTGVFNSLQAVAGYTFNSNNSVDVYYGGNLGRTGVHANTYGNGSLAYSNSYVGAAPEFENSQMVGAFYSYTVGHLNLVPELQYEYAKADATLGIQKGMSNIVGAVFADYSFGTSPYSVGAWVEYFDQHESVADATNGTYWFYGPNATGEAISVTPTWQEKDIFLRADVGALLLNRTSAYGLPKYGYGNQHNDSFQLSGLLETGLVF